MCCIMFGSLFGDLLIQLLYFLKNKNFFSSFQKRQANSLSQVALVYWNRICFRKYRFNVVCGPLCFKSEKTGLPNLIRSLVRKEIFQPEKDLGKEVFVREWNWFFFQLFYLVLTVLERKERVSFSPFYIQHR